MNVQKFKRGQIWWYKTGVKFDGNTYNESKPRPIIIVSNDLANANSNCLIGVPCTTQEKKNIPTHVKFYIENIPNTALAENLMSISTEKLVEYIGVVDNELLSRIEKCLKIALGLEEYKDNIPSPTNPVPIELQTNYQPISSEGNFSNITSQNINDVITDVNTKKSNKSNSRKRIVIEDKHKFLDDYINKDKDYMLKEYNLKDSKALTQKVYTIRKELGLGVRSK